MNTNNNRKYEIDLSKAFLDDGKYKLRLHNLNGDVLSQQYDFLYLTEDDLVSLAKAVATMNGNRICFCQKVRRRYLTGVHYDYERKQCEFSEPNGYYRIKVEAKPNHVVADPISKLYRVTFGYKNAFGENDSFVYVMREEDFVALGKTACDALTPEDAIEKLLAQK